MWLIHWQILATGLDEDYKKPKGLADQIVRMLDEPDVQPSDRLRLLALYLLHRDGLLPADLKKLHAHASLPPSDLQTLENLSLLGAEITRKLGDKRPRLESLFPRKPPPVNAAEEYALSRYEPVLQSVLESAVTKTLDPTIFPYTKPPLDLNEGSGTALAHATSLRSTANKPSWAKPRTTNVGSENRQRVIVFVAGGATWSESRVCYEVGRQTGREVMLVTSHMLNPELFFRQVADLSADSRRLGIPAEAPKPRAPAHLFEADPQPKAQAPPPPQQQQQQQQRAQAPPTQQMGDMSLTGGPNGPRAQPQAQQPVANSSAKLTKEREPEKKEKKKHHFGFGKRKD